jgi:hypothetical protein
LSSASPVLNWVAPSTANDVKLADIRAALSSEDTLSASVVGLDTIYASFSAPPLQTGLVRDSYLAVGGTPYRPAGGAGSGSMLVKLPELVTALHQSQPNPSRGTTAIGFDLATTTSVRLEVFDLLGRRVRTLVSGVVGPGTHQATWDGLDNEGKRVRAGIYIYRLAAGGFSARRRMVVLGT